MRFVVIDELVEAANVPDGVGVQCHPERMVRAHEADERDSLSPMGAWFASLGTRTKRG